MPLSCGDYYWKFEDNHLTEVRESEWRGSAKKTSRKDKDLSLPVLSFMAWSTL